MMLVLLNSSMKTTLARLKAPNAAGASGKPACHLGEVFFRFECLCGRHEALITAEVVAEAQPPARAQR